jgi:hypothetical protein
MESAIFGDIWEVSISRACATLLLRGPGIVANGTRWNTSVLPPLTVCH